MKTITFTSHYNAVRVNVKLKDYKAYSLINDNPGYSIIELYNIDCDRIASGYMPHYFSRSQILRLKSSLYGTDYYDSAELR